MTTDRVRERAKAVIVEIIRQNGGRFYNKTNLFKAFWKAHVEAAKQGDVLSSYKIVKMTHGPGIHEFDSLMSELTEAGLASSAMEECVNGNVATVFRVPYGTGSQADFSDGEIAAIRAGAQWVRGQRADAVSDESHRESRSWNRANWGDEIDVDLDSMSDSEYTDYMTRAAKTRESTDRAFGKVMNR